VDRIRLKRNDILLLCSDGLSGKVKGTEMLTLMQELNFDLKASCNGLIKLANERGGEDNITVVIACFDGEGLEACKPEDPPKGEFVSRDTSLPDEVDAAQLTFGDDETLRPDEDIAAKVKGRGRDNEVVETQEVQATMLNMQAITPQMLAQMSIENGETEAVATTAPPISASTPVEIPLVSLATSTTSNHTSTATHSEEPTEPVEEYQGNNSRMVTLVIVFTILILLIVAAIYFFRS
ncbi:MAG: protein phosphatase, partial [bacterium]